MKYFLEIDNHQKIIAYVPETNLSDSEKLGKKAYSDAEVDNMMRGGEAHLVNDSIIYPPNPGMIYQAGSWSYPADWYARKTANLKTQLLQLCDEKQNDLGRLLLGEKYTPGQIKRYERKYSRAKNGDPTTPENSAIITAHEAYLAQFDEKLDLIEMARHAISRIIEAGEHERAETLLDAVKEFGADTTEASLTALFSGSA